MNILNPIVKLLSLFGNINTNNLFEYNLMDYYTINCIID